MDALLRLFRTTSSRPDASVRPGVFHRFERLQRLGLIGFIALFLVLALMALMQNGRSGQVMQAHEQAQALVGEINQLRGRLLDIEDALRIYQTTDNPALLRLRMRCEPPCPRAAALQALGVEPAQRVLFARIAEWESTLGPLLQQALDGGPATAPLPLPAIAHMRRLLLEAEEVELSRLRWHDEIRRTQNTYLQLVLGATLLLALVGGLLLQQRTRALVQAGLRAEKALEEASLRDPLTGAYNRRGLDQHLERLLRDARRQQQPLAVLALDLDGFKAINDNHGHAAGDTVLREIVARLHGTLRAEDLVTRPGGDEFVVALQAPVDEAQAWATAQRLLQAVSRPLPLPGGATARLSASIGLAQFPRDGGCAQALLAAADTASYAAKRGGKNRICVAGESSVAFVPGALRRVC
ncbi:GGDEF domain-containing protein [Azohydromonas caseinilytica]|uniref:diguanylate cyclase n=1 Tax=Azohydromonas caseinilytica TaxID=2728836 RepID=A0A848FEL4_9BURK|nr:GGDEF domain-containing protein [Azohydromonas caseinilytica]NML17732.1 GGDEF domain-containing protein [Azohydromonas caseinilytica]